jgi:hypothetical protein
MSGITRHSVILKTPNDGYSQQPIMTFPIMQPLFKLCVWAHVSAPKITFESVI